MWLRANYALHKQPCYYSVTMAPQSGGCCLIYAWNSLSFPFHIRRAAVISFHTVLTVVGRKRMPTSVVTAVVLGGWTLTGLLSTRQSPSSWIKLTICSIHWPSCYRDGSAGTVLWYCWCMVFRKNELQGGEDYCALLTSTFLSFVCDHKQTFTMLH